MERVVPLTWAGVNGAPNPIVPQSNPWIWFAVDVVVLALLILGVALVLRSLLRSRRRSADLVKRVERLEGNPGQSVD